VRRRGASAFAAGFGWCAYSPLSSTVYTPNLGADQWVFGRSLAGFGGPFQNALLLKVVSVPVGPVALRGRLATACTRRHCC